MDLAVLADEATSWWSALFSARALGIALWIGLAVLTVTLLVLSRTRWGQAKPLSKCVVLSVFAHFLFLMYAYGTRLIFEQPPVADKEGIRLTIVDAGDQQQRDLDDVDVDQQPWDRVISPAVVQPHTMSPQRLASNTNQHPLEHRETGTTDFDTSAVHDRLQTRPQSRPTAQHRNDDSHLWANDASKSDVEVETPQPSKAEVDSSPVGPSISGPRRVRLTQNDSTLSRKTTPDDANTGFLKDESRMQRLAQAPLVTAKNDAIASQINQLRQSNNKLDSSQQVTAPAPSVKIEADVSDTAQSTPETNSSSGGRAEPKRAADGEDLPSIYKNRASDNFTRIAVKNGGDGRTEAAVRAALKWLVSHQEPDGRWDSSRFGGGSKTFVEQQDRQGAGIEADAAVTGLAILAFLAHGQTHLEGEYRKNVQRGLEFLLRTQKSNGNLAGDARLFAAMYCHGMAMLAISEAYAITGDRRIRPFVERAVKYTVDSQDTTTGGWRYRPGDPGDMSQFGWQVMALKSAEMGGIKIPTRTRAGMLRFINSVSAGNYGGLARYSSRERVNRTMTAESLMSRYLLGTATDPRLVDEATSYIGQDLPRSGTPNLYYWYYGTMAMFQSGGERWTSWNAAMKRQLVGLQQTTGDNAGSWAPATVWGGCGGRVYSTAMATLCLEIYYRYLPILADNSSR